MVKPLDPERAAELLRVKRELEEAISRMSANGLTPQEISLVTGIKPERLWRRYREAMQKGGARRKNEVAESAFLMATGGPEKDWRRADAGMAKFWLERRGGSEWASPERGGDDGPDLTRLSVPQLIELQRALKPLARGGMVIDGTVEHAVVRGGDGGADAAGAGSESDGGVGEHHDDAGEVSG